MPNAKNLTTISITKSNYEILKNLGKTGDSFNDVLTRLLNSKRIQNKMNEKVTGLQTQQQQATQQSNQPLRGGDPLT